MKLTTFSTKLKEEQSSTAMESKTFKIQNAFCIYNNFAYTTEESEQKLQPKTIKINNKICHEKDGKLEKITEILYQGKKITLKDNYEFLNNEISLRNRSPDYDSSKHKKTTLFKKTQVEEGSKHLIKRNTKNVVKNFCKGFIHYLKKLKDQGVSFPFDENTSFIFQKNNYNNDLIKKIIRNSKVGPYFKIFLTEEAEAWLEHSKIMNKDVHMEAIELYLKLFEERQACTMEEQNLKDSKVKQLKIEEQSIFEPIKFIKDFESQVNRGQNEEGHSNEENHG